MKKIFMILSAVALMTTVSCGGDCDKESCSKDKKECEKKCSGKDKEHDESTTTMEDAHETTKEHTTEENAH